MNPILKPHTGDLRQMDKVDSTARLKATSCEGVKKWFDAVTELWVENQYPSDRSYNMDESGFAVGAG
jgi:hypothetical protein